MKANLRNLLTSFSNQNSRWGHSYVAAFTSSVSGEGVSYVVNEFACALASKAHQRIIVADSAMLQKVSISNKKRTRFVQSANPNVFVLGEASENEPQDFDQQQGLVALRQNSNVERAITNLQALRYAFDLVLIDCSSMNDSADAAFLAPVVDGVVLVVEANRTQGNSVRESIKTLNLAKGNLLGCVMNRRRYPIPRWIFGRL